METIRVPEAPDYRAPDGSEIRLLPGTARGGMSHCTLPGGAISTPVEHRTVEEVWYCVSGRGQIWRRYGSASQVDTLSPGTSVLIPFRTAFQFRSEGPEPLVLVIATFPGWPGPEEAVPVAEGKWEARSG